MNEEMGAPVVNPEEEPKRNTTLITIVWVVVVLCLCCLVTAVVLWFTGDAILEALGVPVTLVPGLPAVF